MNEETTNSAENQTTAPDEQPTSQPEAGSSSDQEHPPSHKDMMRYFRRNISSKFEEYRDRKVTRRRATGKWRWNTYTLHFNLSSECVNFVTFFPNFVTWFEEDGRNFVWANVRTTNESSCYWKDSAWAESTGLTGWKDQMKFIRYVIHWVLTIGKVCRWLS